MTEKELEILTKLNPDAHERFKKSRCKKRFQSLFEIFKRIRHHLSSAILWICAVGGFILSLIQFFQNQN